jgi:hypothetical protein
MPCEQPADLATIGVRLDISFKLLVIGLQKSIITSRYTIKIISSKSQPNGLVAADEFLAVLTNYEQQIAGKIMRYYL